MVTGSMDKTWLFLTSDENCQFVTRTLQLGHIYPQTFQSDYPNHSYRSLSCCWTLDNSDVLNCTLRQAKSVVSCQYIALPQVCA